MAPPSGPIADLEVASISKLLRRVVAKGLPVTESTADDELINLRSVYARSIHPRERLSRIEALNKLLPRFIDSFSDEVYREALRILFGLATGSRRTSLKRRQEMAAEVMAYSVDHFADEVQKRLLDDLAMVVHADLERYKSRVRRTPESDEVTGDTPSLYEHQVTHQEELISRIWQHVYGMRAELIAFARLSEIGDVPGPAEDHRQAALRLEAALKAVIAEYVETYGDALIAHGEAEFTAEAVERLSTWTL